MDYTRASHSKHCLMAHLIFVCKYRRKLLVQYGEEIKEILVSVSEENNIHIIEMEVDKDHLHVLIQYSPTQSILEIVRKFKRISTYRIWRQNNNHLCLSKYFWRENIFWSDGYFVSSIGQVSEETIRKYIANQG